MLYIKVQLYFPLLGNRYTRENSVKSDRSSKADGIRCYCRHEKLCCKLTKEKNKNMKIRIILIKKNLGNISVY